MKKWLLLLGLLLLGGGGVYLALTHVDDDATANRIVLANGNKIINRKYYDKHNRQIVGYHHVKQHWYLFTKAGWQTGLHYISANRSYGYFNAQGQQVFHTVNTKRKKYFINPQTGAVVGVLNHAKVIKQMPQMPSGCEVTSVTMMLNYAGVAITKQKVASVMNYSSDPALGFVGSPYSATGIGLWVKPTGIASVVNKYLHHADVMTGASMSQIKAKLRQGHLVCVWVRDFDGFASHTFALTGYNGTTLYYNDPWTGKHAKISQTEFIQHWQLNQRMALSY